MTDEDFDDITPMEIDELDDTETAVNDPDDPEEYANWDRDRDGYLSDYATDDEPACLAGDDAEVGE